MQKYFNNIFKHNIEEIINKDIKLVNRERLRANNDSYLEVAAKSLGYKNVLELKKT